MSLIPTATTTIGAAAGWSDGPGLGAWLVLGATWWPETWLFWVDWLVRAALIVRVIMRRLPVQVSMAWLVVLLFAPIIGIFLYIMVGENRLGSKRLRRFEAL